MAKGAGILISIGKWGGLYFVRGWSWRLYFASWRELKLSGNGDWSKAIAVDEAIRKARPPYDLFVHPARIPLIDIDLRNLQDKGQLSLWDDECSGICGV